MDILVVISGKTTLPALLASGNPLYPTIETVGLHDLFK